MSKRKNPAAVALGRKGGKAGTEAQAAARRANGAKGGRPAERAAILSGVTPNRATVVWIGEGRDVDAAEVFEALEEHEIDPKTVGGYHQVRLIPATAKVGERIWLQG